MNKILSFLLLLSSLVHSNEISFYEIKDSGDQSSEISFLLDKVSFIKSYSLVDPSRIVIDVYQSDLKLDVEEKYNYPIKLVRASSKDDLTRIVIDLYEYVNWSKPTQEKTDEGILLKINVKKNKKIKNNIRDIVVAIDAGHGGKDPGAVSSNNVLEKDITLLTYSRMRHHCLKAVEELEKKGIDVELIDLISLKPFDMETISKSIRKTNKVIIVEECMKTGGIGAELIALITEECFDDLDARPIRLSSQDIPTPYNGNLENLTIIQPHQIVEKVEHLYSGSI